MKEINLKGRKWKKNLKFKKLISLKKLKIQLKLNLIENMLIKN